MFSLKMVTVFDDNPQRGLPLVQATVILTDGATGTPLAVMDGASLTAIRTGAASGLATDLLASADTATAAVIGTGVQAPALNWRPSAACGRFGSHGSIAATRRPPNVSPT